MEFKDPWILFFILFVFPILFFSQIRKKASFRFSSLELLQDIPSTWKITLNTIFPVLRFLVLLLFIIALAGPRKVLEETVHKTEGIDIVIAIDASGSMAAEDFKLDGRHYNRLEVVKSVVREFISQRSADRIGLIAFAGYAYTVCPLTTDYNWLKENMERIQLGMLEDGTAIGSAIASSVARLKNSQAKSKIIILLTDGVNNAGKISPLQAAQIAKQMNIKIYTIGVGARGFAPYPVQDFFGRTVYQNVAVEIDETTLKEIARITGGLYFRATDTETLRNIYREIDQLEKSRVEETGYKEYRELFASFLIAALSVLLLEILLSNTILLKIP